MRIFLSYNSKDKGLAQAIRSGLLRLDSSANIFYDELSLESGFWLPKIFGSIAQADGFLFLIGPQGIGPWQEVEYWTAFQRHVEQRAKMSLVPVIVGNTEAPGLAGLRSLNWVVSPNVQDDLTLHKILTALKGEAIDAATTPLWKLVNPYRGLEAMNEVNADYFYGRTGETIEILSCLGERPSRFPVLVGASGVGKSSIALAGVLSSLKSMRWPSESGNNPGRSWPTSLQSSRGWALLTVRPGDAPIKALVSAFTRFWSLDLTDPDQAARPRSWMHRLEDGENNLSDLIDATQAEIKKREGAAPEAVLVYLDQAEELYTLSNRKEAERFSHLLAEGLKDPRLRAFATLRVDDLQLFEADTTLRACSELIQVHPLTRDGLYKVVTEPPRLLQVAFEDDLLAGRLTEAASKEPGALPLLSYQLNSMWLSMVRRGDAILRLPSQAIDVGGVLSSRAEDFLKANPDSEGLLKRLLTLRLTTVYADGTRVSRQATREECPDAEWALASSLAASQWRLTVISNRDSDGKVVAEVGHEAFLSGWPRLERWLTEEREFLVFKGDVERKNREWREAKMADARLLAGRDLGRADDWIVLRKADLPNDVVEFVYASRIYENRKQESQIRYQRLGLAAAAAALVLVAALSVGLWTFWKQAQQQLRNAQRAESLRLAQLAGQRGHDVASAMLLALEGLPDSAVDKDRPIVPEAELQLDRALHGMHEALVLPLENPAAAAVFSADGNRIIAVSHLTTMWNWDARSGKALDAPIQVQEDTALQTATISADGKLVAMLLDSATVLVRNTETRKDTRISGSALRRAAFTRDGKRLVTVSGDGVAQIFDLDNPDKPIKSIQCEPVNGVESVEFSPDGTRIVTGSLSGTARIFNTNTGEKVGEPMPHVPGVSSVTFNFAGTRVLTASIDGTMKIWDAASGVPVGNLLPGNEELTTARFGPDGKLIAAAAKDGTIRLWDVENEKLQQSFSGHAADIINSLAFSPDGTRIVSSSEDSTVRVWTIQATRIFLVDRPVSHRGIVRDVRFSRAGNQLVTASEDGTAVVKDVERGPSTTLKSADGKLTAATFDPAGTSIVTGSAKGALQIWDKASGSSQSISAHKNEIWALEFSPDGKLLLTGSEDGSAKIWEYASRRPLYTIDARKGAVRSAAFSPDGKLIAIGYLNRVTLLWDAQTGKPVAAPNAAFGSHPGTIRSVTFSPDSQYLLTASANGSAKISDIRTGEVRPIADGDGGAFRSAFFSPDGKHVITASDSGTVQIWERSSGKLTRELASGGAAAWKALYSPDGKQVAIASADGTASVSRIPDVLQMVDEAKPIAPRCLTLDERSRWFLASAPPAWCDTKWPFNTPELKDFR